MKRINKIILLVAVATLLASCEKYLETEPIGLLTPEQVDLEPTATSVIYTVKSSYQMLSSTFNILEEWKWEGGTVFRGDIILQDIASNDMQRKWNLDGDQAWMDELSNFSYTPENGGFRGIWLYDYNGISRANTAIDYLTDSELLSKINLDADLKDRMLGEVYFLRAFYYFDLVTNFGDVPLLTTPLKNFADAYVGAERTPKENIWAQISSDLTAAKALLPQSKYSDTNEKWRVSWGAVAALQAKVALYNEEWQDVVDRVTELEALYSLNSNYFDSFDVTKEFAENEVIFAYNHEQGKTPRNGNSLGAFHDWGFIAPTTDFVNAFEDNDPRLLYTIDSDNQWANKILGTIDGSGKGNDDWDSNKVYIRFADALLWKAEAYNELGNYSEAIAAINQVRTRARTTVAVDGNTPPAGTLPDRVASTNKTQIKDWLVHERRVELGFESQRFNDLKRWGIAKDFFTGLGKNFQDHNYLYPIPQEEIDKTNGTITQNPGY